jgi:serine/threonine-protein kinase
MGTVYSAEADATGELLAVKIIAAGPSHDTRFRERFERECALAASLHHPNVVTTIASGETAGHLYLAMEYVEGSDLREILRREAPLEPARALRLVEQVADALDAAHKLGLVHRDVKPGNILVTGRENDERALVCDFGLARHVSSASSLTGDRGFVGTIDYVPPEQIEGKQVDQRSDLYSLACVLFECLVGAKPFERESELSVVFAHLNDPPPRPTEFRPTLPKAWDDFFAKALTKEPGERFGSGRELVEAARAADTGKRRRSRKGRRWLTGAAAAAVVAAAVGAVVALDGGAGEHGRAQITQSAIAGAPLGRSAKYYRKHFGPRSYTLAGVVDYPTLNFTGPEVDVYFPKRKTPIPAPGQRAHIIATWNRSYRTAAGIGPCSTLSAAKRAYGDRWKPSPSAVANWHHRGVYSAYVVGNNLIFETQDGRTVSAIGLYEGNPHFTGHNSPQSYANFVTANQTACE